MAHRSTRGRITLHSALTFTPLRSFAPVTDPSYGLSTVERIILHGDGETVLWNVGSKVCYWHVGSLQESKGKGKVKAKARGRSTPKSVSKWIGESALPPG
jgi:hypothetical protein